ncbi:MAG: HAD-IIB family hydrolase [Gammaproteobacteria bacterium]|nr:HAD-IIB family hydrolase [Gammaproteobacteria bacterium]
MKKLLVFTDLDGTLLDHHDYSWSAAADALSQLAEQGIPLIINSSKTRSEILDLRQELENQHPFIVENGSALYYPSGYFSEGGIVREGSLESCYFATRRDEILGVLDSLKKTFGFRFRGFSDMTAKVLAEETGLSLKGAQKANERDCSEPLQWQDTRQRLEAFCKAVESHGLRVLRGGRFYHVMGETDKAAGIRWLVQRYRKALPDSEFVTVALGDSPNDQAMLEAVDIPVVIEPAAGDPLKLVDFNSVIYAGAKGPAGWQRAMSRILETFPD